MEYCELYQQGFAKGKMLLGVESVLCPLHKTRCPYKNGATLEGSDDPVNLCQTSGVVEKSGLITSVEELIQQQDLPSI